MKRKLLLAAAAAVIAAMFALNAGDRPRRANAQDVSEPQPLGAARTPDDTRRDPPSDATDTPSRKDASHVRGEIERLLFADPHMELQSLLDDFVRRVTHAENSGRHLTEPGGRFFPFRRYLDGKVELSIVDDSTSFPHVSFPGQWDLLVSVETLLNNETVSLRDKIDIAHAILESTGSIKESSRTGEKLPLRNLYGELLEVRAALAEARKIRGLLGDGFNETQARQFVRGMRGWLVGQDRLTQLREILRDYQDLTETEVRLLRAEIEELTETKGRVLRDLLPSAQLDKLYRELKYDSDEYWVMRRPR